MSSCSFGTSASFARLPMSDVVLRSRTSSVWGEGSVIVRVGCSTWGCGGVSRTCTDKPISEAFPSAPNTFTYRRGEDGEGDGE